MRRYRTRGGSVKINMVLSEPPRYEGVSEDEPQMMLNAGRQPLPLDRLPRARLAGRDAGQAGREPLRRGRAALGRRLQPHRRRPLGDDDVHPVRAARRGGLGRTAPASATPTPASSTSPATPRTSPDAILEREVLAPPDLERIFGLVDGSIFQGEQGLDQMAFMRPTPSSPSTRPRSTASTSAAPAPTRAAASWPPRATTPRSGSSAIAAAAPFAPACCAAPPPPSRVPLQRASARTGAAAHRIACSGMAAERTPRIAPGGRRQIGLLNAGIARLAAARDRGPAAATSSRRSARHRRLFRRWLLVRRGADARRQAAARRDRAADPARRPQHRLRVRVGPPRAHRPAGRAQRGGDRSGSARARRPTGWSERRALLLRAADELHADGRDRRRALGAAGARSYDEVELIELCMLVGHYEMLAMTLNSLGVAARPPAPGSCGGRRGT